MKNDLITAYAKATHILGYATTGLTREDYLATPGPGLWSLAEVTIHIVDAELVLADRIKRVIAEDNPALLAFDESKWKENLFYKPAAVAAAVRLFAANREYVSLILENISEEDLQRTGVHSQAGTLTLQAIIEKANWHFDHHINFLYAKRANIEKPVNALYTV